MYIMQYSTCKVTANIHCYIHYSVNYSLNLLYKFHSCTATNTFLLCKHIPTYMKEGNVNAHAFKTTVGLQVR